MKNAEFINSTISAARTIGLIDTIYLRSEGSSNIVVGDNTLWRGIYATLISDLAPLAYRNITGLVLANFADDASAAIYALLQLACSPIYTIGFSSHYPSTHVQHLRNPSALKSIERNLFVMISALPAEHSYLCHPLLRMSQSLSSHLGRVFVDLANGPRRGDPMGVAKHMGWNVYGSSEIAAWCVKEALGLLIGSSVPFGFIRTACGGRTR